MRSRQRRYFTTLSSSFVVRVLRFTLTIVSTLKTIFNRTDETDEHLICLLIHTEFMSILTIS